MAYQFTNCFNVNAQCVQIDPSIQFNSISNENFLGRFSSLLFIDKTVTVNSTADVVDQSDGVTTLREAINQANANRGEDTIVFDPSVFTGQAITLNLGQLNITDSLNINGSINGQITINGNKASRVFEISSQATVNLSGLMIINGVTADKGGAIFNAGTLVIENSTLSNNQADSGGAIFNTASLTISKSAIINNNAYKDGGGIFNDGYFGMSNLIISYTYIGGNSAKLSGGGVANFNGGAFDFSYGSISDNSALGGSGIFNAQGTVKIDYSTIKDNTGAGESGGIINYGTLNISNSTVSGNSRNNPISISNPIKIML